MPLPNHMSEPCFTVAEAAAMASVPVATLRTWLARNSIALIGSKPKGRIWFTGHEVFVVAIMRDLIAAGYTPGLAMLTAWRLAGGPVARAPNAGSFAAVGLDGDADFIDRVGNWADLSSLPRTALVLPLAAMWSDIAAKASKLYEAA